MCLLITDCYVKHEMQGISEEFLSFHAKTLSLDEHENSFPFFFSSIYHTHMAVGVVKLAHTHIISTSTYAYAVA